jgi:hypothetical protein
MCHRNKQKPYNKGMVSNWITEFNEITLAAVET